MFSDPPAYGELRTGWYQIDGYWYLTAGAAKRELRIPTEQLEKCLVDVATETLTNPYNERPFIVYSLDSLHSLKKFKWKRMLV